MTNHHPWQAQSSFNARFAGAQERKQYFVALAERSAKARAKYGLSRRIDQAVVELEAAADRGDHRAYSRWRRRLARLEDQIPDDDAAGAR